MDILGQTALLVGVTSFALGLSVLARNVTNKLFIAFSVVCSLISGWGLSFFLEKLFPGLGYYRLHLFFNVLLAPGALVLIRVMVRIHDTVSRRLLVASATAAFFLSLAVLTHLESLPLVRWAIYFSPVLIVLQVLHLMRIDQLIRKGMQRLPKMPTIGLGKRTIIYVGALLVLLTCVMDHVPLMGRTLPAFGNIGLTIYLFFLSQAITQQRLLNIGALFSRFLVLVAVAMTLTFVYSVLVAWIESSPGLFILNSFIASFLILMLLDPLRTLVGYFTQRLMGQKHKKLQTLLREAERKLTGTVDLTTLFQIILTTAEQSLKPEWAAFYVLRSDGTKLRRIKSISLQSGVSSGSSSPGTVPNHSLHTAAAGSPESLHVHSTAAVSSQDQAPLGTQLISGFESSEKVQGLGESIPASVGLASDSSSLLKASERQLQKEEDANVSLEDSLEESRVQGRSARNISLKSIKRATLAFSSEDNGPREVLANQPLLQYSENLAKKGRFPVLLDQIFESEIDRSASKSQREEYRRLMEGLKALGANILIPLFSSGKMLGFVALRVSAPPEPWENNWGILPMIYPFFEQAAQVMQRMEIYAKQREKERLAALGEMAAGLAHEIRNPLGAIKGAAQFLDPSLERPESRFLKIIIEEVDRLNHVVTQFLDYSKPPTESFSKVDLSLLAEKTIESMRPGIPESIELEFEPLKGQVWVMASAQQIQQVLINLIQNAIKALESKPKGMIRVSLEKEGDGAGAEVWLSVEDTGKGIKKENLDKLFIPFFTTSPEGTGLGLSISHKITEAHRGRIEVASEEGVFSRFSIVLPLVKVLK